jgi:hypothetical protein
MEDVVDLIKVYLGQSQCPNILPVNFFCLLDYNGESERYGGNDMVTVLWRRKNQAW